MFHPQCRIHIVPVVVVALTLYLATVPIAVTAAPPSMPGDVQLIQPDPSLPKALRAFSGKWEGSGHHVMPSFPIELFIIVEKLTDEKATLYVWYSPMGWNRREASVINESGKYKLSYMGPYGKNEITPVVEDLVFDAQPSYDRPSFFTLNLKRVP